MLRFLNNTTESTTVDIFINNRKIVSQLAYGATSVPFDAKLGLYTIEVITNGESLLRLNFQLRHTNTTIAIIGNPPEVELRLS